MEVELIEIKIAGLTATEFDQNIDTINFWLTLLSDNDVDLFDAPIVIDASNNIIDGHHRVRASVAAGRETIFAVRIIAGEISSEAALEAAGKF